MLRYQKSCRACGNEKLVPVFNLGIQPLANDFTGPDGRSSGYAPLEVLHCPDCTLAQLSVVVDPAILYSNYNYTTSRSQTMKEHFAALWQAIKHYSNAESVIEIGSNDCNFLEYCRDNGAQHLCGIDPSANLSVCCANAGIRTIVGCLDVETAKLALCEVPKPDVIVARHVFAHTDDWKGFFRSMDAMAHGDTLVVLEMPYLVDTLARCEWDQVYHEHLSYVSLKAIAALLETTPFRIQSMKLFPVHGGSMVVFIRRRDFPIAPDAGVAVMIAVEKIMEASWKEFASVATERIGDLRVMVRALREGGKKVVGYGASAKSTVWVSACGFTRKDLDFICDSTPQKQGKFSPGTDIPIVSEEHFRKSDADYAVIFSWNYATEIVRNNQAFLERGGRFIHPHQGKVMDEK